MKSVRLVLPLVTPALAACSTPPDPELTGSDEAEIRALVGGELAGSIACGETKKVEHAGDPDYRALSIAAKKGQALDIRVRAPGMDPRAWLTTPKGTALAKNDDESASSKDSHIVSAQGAAWRAREETPARAGGIAEASRELVVVRVPDELVVLLHDVARASVRHGGSLSGSTLPLGVFAFAGASRRQRRYSRDFLR